MIDHFDSHPLLPRHRCGLILSGVGIVGLCLTMSVAQESTELQRIRAASNAARADANEAATLRSSETSVQEQQYQRAIDAQRANKLAKARAAEAARLQKAANAYKPVSQSDVRALAPQSTPTSNQPSPTPPERATSSERPAVGNALRAPGNAMKNIIGKLPFGKKDEPAPPYASPASSYTQPPSRPSPPATVEPEKTSLFKKVGSVFKGNRDNEPTATNIPQVNASELTAEINQKEESGLKNLTSKIPFIGKNKKEGTADSDIATANRERPALSGSVNDAVDTKETPFIKDIASKIPFVGKKDKASTNSSAPTSGPSSEANETENKPLIQGIASKIPFIGNKNKDSDSPFASTASPAPQPSPTAPVRIPTISATGAGLVQTQTSPSEPAPAATPAPTVATTSLVEEEKEGFFNKMKNRVASIGSNVGSIGNSDSQNVPAARPSDGSLVDASLFPVDATQPALPAGNTRNVSSDEILTGTPGTASAASLPQATPEKKGLLSGIGDLTSGLGTAISGGTPEGTPQTIPRPPKLAPEKKVRSTSHSGGNSTYVVATNSKFFRFGDTQFSSEVNDLAAGTLVQMVKAGDEWSSVKLQSGATGNIKNKNLQPANADQAASVRFGSPAASTNSVSIAR